MHLCYIEILLPCFLIVFVRKQVYNRGSDFGSLLLCVFGVKSAVLLYLGCYLLSILTQPPRIYSVSPVVFGELCYIQMAPQLARCLSVGPSDRS